MGELLKTVALSASYFPIVFYLFLYLMIVSPSVMRIASRRYVETLIPIIALTACLYRSSILSFSLSPSLSLLLLSTLSHLLLLSTFVNFHKKKVEQERCNLSRSIWLSKKFVEIFLFFMAKRFVVIALETILRAQLIWKILIWIFLISLFIILFIDLL